MRLFIDTETTGLDLDQGHRLIEVAAVAYGGRSKVEEFHEYIDPEREIDPNAFEIHGISNDKLRGKPKFADIADSLAKFISGSEFIAHNADFDVSFLDMEFERCGMKPVAQIASGITDTLVQARELFPNQSNSLDALARRFGIDIEERRKFHGALVDAEILFEVCEKMNSGQNELDLKAELAAGALKMPAVTAEIIRLAPSKEAAAAHAKFMSDIRERLSS